MTYWKEFQQRISFSRIQCLSVLLMPCRHYLGQGDRFSISSSQTSHTALQCNGAEDLPVDWCEAKWKGKRSSEGQSPHCKALLASSPDGLQIGPAAPGDVSIINSAPVIASLFYNSDVGTDQLFWISLLQNMYAILALTRKSSRETRLPGFQ